jgi:outer membrane protein, heavy metal efflux system
LSPPLRTQVGAVLLVALGATACVASDAGYGEVRKTTAARIRQEVRWYEHDSESRAQARTRELLAKPLAAEGAVQVALLNNQGLQATFEELGIARGRLVQALSLPNPSVEGAMRFRGSERPELEVGATIDLTELLLLPWRGGSASAGLDAAKLEVAGRVLDLAYAVRVAFFEYQAALQTLELRGEVLSALRASFAAAEALHEAGNITDLAFANERALYEEARLAQASAEAALETRRNQLATLMGVWAVNAKFTTEGRLGDPQPVESILAGLERRALEQSLDLAAIRERYRAAAKAANFANVRGFLPELEAGVSAERDEEGWGVGPAASLELPLFYQGQGEVATALAQARAERRRHNDMAVRIRATARSTAIRLRTSAESAKYYREVLLPLREQIVAGTLLQFNAMSVGVFQLLQAKRAQIQSAEAYVNVLRDYWTTRAAAEQLLAGRVPAGLAEPAGSQTSQTGTDMDAAPH